MTHLDLFSGIGGFALAADAVWPDVEHAFVEIDPFCQAILNKQWPTSKVYGNIKEYVAALAAYAASEQAHPTESGGLYAEFGIQNPRIDLITGGFPCQPFSQAGRRKGTEDDRYLWPEMFAVIEHTLPRWVIAENVRGLTTWDNGVVLEKCCTDLESIGYEVQPVIIPACAVGAPHRRDRVWIIGHAKHDGRDGSKDEKGGQEGGDGDTEGKDELRKLTRPALPRDDVANSTSEGGKLWKRSARNGSRTQERVPRRNHWGEDWPQVATRLCRMDDGLPQGLSRPRGWRNAALKAYGNAIVPQVAIKIMEAIKQVEEKTTHGREGA